jgi:hypothetical protein
MKAGIALGIAVVIGVAAVLFFALDNVLGDDSRPYPGKVVDKIHRPAYTTTHYVHRPKGRSGWVTRHHPATYHIEVAAPDTTFSWNLFRDTFYRVSVGQDVTLTKRFGRWSHHSYGWRVASFTRTIALPE